LLAVVGLGEPVDGVRNRQAREPREGCQNPVSSCCGEVLVETSAESVVSLDAYLPRRWRWRLGRDRRLAAKRTVCPLGVVMVDVDA
jgi:hypothetical protein